MTCRRTRAEVDCRICARSAGKMLSLIKLSKSGRLRVFSFFCSWPSCAECRNLTTDVEVDAGHLCRIVCGEGETGSLAMGPAVRDAAPQKLIEEALVFDPTSLFEEEMFRRSRRCVERSDTRVFDGGFRCSGGACRGVHVDGAPAKSAVSGASWCQIRRKSLSGRSTLGQLPVRRRWRPNVGLRFAPCWLCWCCHDWFCSGVAQWQTDRCGYAAVQVVWCAAT